MPNPGLEYENLLRWRNHDPERRPLPSDIDIWPQHNFIEILRKDFWDYEKHRLKPERNARGKFYLSVAEDDLPKAWNLIADLLFYKPEMPLMAKVSTPEGIKYTQEKMVDAQGKHIVLYFDGINMKNTAGWNKLLNAIETIFAEKEIKPGPTINGVNTVPGGRYTYWRYGNTLYSLTTGQSLTPETEAGELSSLTIGTNSAETGRHPRINPSGPPGITR